MVWGIGMGEDSMAVPVGKQIFCSQFSFCLVLLHKENKLSQISVDKWHDLCDFLVNKMFGLMIS